MDEKLPDRSAPERVNGKVEDTVRVEPVGVDFHSRVHLNGGRVLEVRDGRRL